MNGLILDNPVYEGVLLILLGWGMLISDTLLHTTDFATIGQNVLGAGVAYLTLAGHVAQQNATSKS